MAIFGNKDKNGNFTINFKAVEDTILWDKLYAISITLLEDKMEFKNRLNKNKPSVFLEYDKVVDIQMVTKKIVLEKEKSIIGQGLLGKALFGDAGMYIGVVDAASRSNKEVKNIKYLGIKYVSNNEEKFLPVEVVGATLGLRKFIKELEKRCVNLEKLKEDNNKEIYL